MFRLVKILGGRINEGEPQSLPAAAGTRYSFGCALKMQGGTLTHCTATDVPTMIGGEERPEGAASNMIAYPIDGNMIFAVPVSAVPTALHVGDKVTLHVSDGEAVGVTATTASGVATIYDLCGACAAGDIIHVRIL